MNEFLAVCLHWTLFFCLGGAEWVLGSIWVLFKNWLVQRRGAAKETEEKRVEAEAGLETVRL